MRKIVFLNCLVVCGLIAAGCGDDGDDDGNGGTGGGNAGSTAGTGGGGGGTGGGGGAPPEDPPNSECPQDVGPFDGPYVQKGACCYRTANSTAISKQTGDKRTLAYRTKYFLTNNHQMTMGSLSGFTIDRYNREEQSIIFRITVPWENGKMKAGMGVFQVGAGRYNCDGTYSFYSDTAAPSRGKLTDPSRWVSSTVPVTVNPDGATLADQIKPVWAENMRSRVPTFLPFLKTQANPDGTQPLEWESSSTDFLFEMAPKLDDKSANCMGKRNEAVWEKGANTRSYVSVDANNQDPIMTIGGITLAQLQAYGATAEVVMGKDTPKYDPTKKESRCMPGSADCPWKKLPESLCPYTPDEQTKWSCHVGWADNPDGLKTNCTQEPPMGVLDPDKGMNVSQGQCCDPLGKSATLPHCNAWVNIFDVVFASAEITDKLANEVQQNCKPH